MRCLGAAGLVMRLLSYDAFRLAAERSAANWHSQERQAEVDRLSVRLDTAIEIRGKNGRRAQILVLSREQARNIWKAPLGARERLVYSPADVYFDSDSAHLNSTEPVKLRLGIFPDPQPAAEGFHRLGGEGIFGSYSAATAPVDAKANVQLVREPAAATPIRMGKEIAMAPEDSAFEGAALWKIHVPDVKSPAVKQVLLRIAYQGDIARIYAGNRLITDDFYHGAPWEIGLEDIAPADLKQGLRLQILPLRADAPIYPGEGSQAFNPARGSGGAHVRSALDTALPGSCGGAPITRKAVYASTGAGLLAGARSCALHLNR
jgi:hypothetical protein